MNITQSNTTAGANAHEIALRTMASDIASLERGNQMPVAIHVVPHPKELLREGTIAVPQSHISVTRLILVLLFLTAVGVGMYTYVYPYLTGSVKP